MAGTAVSEIYCCKINIDNFYIYLASTKNGAVRIGMTLKNEGNCIAFFRKLFQGSGIYEDYRVNAPLIDGVEAALYNKPLKSSIDFDLSVTSFQWLVLKAVKLIPYGKTKTYGELGHTLRKPGSARAVGQAVAKNPLPIIFP